MVRTSHTGSLIMLFIAIAVATACKKFVTVDPPLSEVINETVFRDDRSATSAIAGIYSDMMNSSVFAGHDIGYYAAMSADELNVFAALDIESQQFENNSLIPANAVLLNSFWEPGYRYIWYANSAISGLEASTTVSEPVKRQLLGEAKFIRAFCHFYLTAFFGDIPYVTSTDYKVNAAIPKIAQSSVYNHIIDDLVAAHSDLSADYVTPYRVRPNKAAALALLARVYLYTEDWQKAESHASAVIEDVRYQLETDIGKVFLAESKEAIWQLMPVAPGHNAFEMSYVTTGSQGGLSLTSQLMNSFDSSDLRRTLWIQSWTNTNGTITNYYPYKYKVSALGQPLTEFNMVFRLAEQLLIRAEARARQGKLTGANSAASDLNRVRNRAGLDDTAATTQEEILDAILQERRHELFTEWGHRWCDLRRMNKTDVFLAPLKADWSLTDTLYPLPQLELIRNKNLLPQNEGYE